MCKFMANKSWSVGQTSTTTKHGSVNYWINNFYTSLVILFIWNLADLRINSYGLFTTQQSIDHEPRPPPQNSLPFYIYNTNVFIWPPPHLCRLIEASWFFMMCAENLILHMLDVWYCRIFVYSTGKKTYLFKC